jgi:hypothetical protein
MESIFDKNYSKFRLFSFLLLRFIGFIEGKVRNIITNIRILFRAIEIERGTELTFKDSYVQAFNEFKTK